MLRLFALLTGLLLLAQPLAAQNVKSPTAPSPTPPSPTPKPKAPGVVSGIIVDVTRDETTSTGTLVVAVEPPNMKYSFYEGSYVQLPDFNKLTPTYSGAANGFDLSLALQHDNFAMVFEGFLKIAQAGTYKFYVPSDDGSRLYIDGNVIVDNDGLHTTAVPGIGSAKLTAGVHKLQLAYFQHWGLADLKVQIEGPGVAKQDVSPYVYLSSTAKKSTPASKTYIVNEATKFEIVRGNVRTKSNILREHIGERVDVFPVPKSTPASAAKVEILLPLPPAALPSHVKPSSIPLAGPSTVYGKVVTLGKVGSSDSVTIQLHEPPPAVTGQVVDVSINDAKEVGYVTVKTASGSQKFTVPSWASIATWTGSSFAYGTFLSIQTGQNVVVFPYAKGRATRIDIMDSTAAAVYLAKHPQKHHYVTFLVNSATTFVRHRDSQNKTADQTAVQVGEEVGILPNAVGSLTAGKVTVFLPHSIHGILAGIAPTYLTLTLHDGTTVLAPINTATLFETVDKKIHTSAAAAALVVGEHVVVYPAGPAPHYAEKVSVRFHHKVVKGTYVSSTANTIVVNVAASPQTFQLGSTTGYFMLQPGTPPTPTTTGALASAKGLVLHVKDTVPPLAEKVEILVYSVTTTGTLVNVNNSTITVKGTAGNATFQFSPAVTFEMLNNGTPQPSTSSALKANQTLTIFGHNGPTPVADKVQIVSTPAVAKPTTTPGKPFTVKGHIAATTSSTITLKVNNKAETFQLAPSATIEVHQGKNHSAGNMAALQIGKEAVVHAQHGKPPLAMKIEVMLPTAASSKTPTSKPFTVRGDFAGLNGAAIAVKVKNGGKSEMVEAIQLSPSAVVHLQKGEMRVPTNASMLPHAKQIVIHGHTGPPKTAERIDIIVPPAKSVTISGILVNAAMGAVQVKNKNGVHTFQLAPTTTLEAKVKGKSVAGNVAMLTPGREVVIHGWTDFPHTVANKIEIKK